MRSPSAWLALGVLCIASASPLATAPSPTPLDDSHPSSPAHPPRATATPTLAAVVLAADAGQTLTVLDVYWPQEHLDARKKAASARTQQAIWKQCLAVGVPIALAGWYLIFILSISNYKKWKVKRQARVRVTTNRRTLAEWRRRNAPAEQTTATGATEAEAGSEGEGYRLVDATRITFAQPADQPLAGEKANKDHDRQNDKEAVPGSRVSAGPSATGDNAPWADNDGRASAAPSEYTRSEYTLPLYRTTSMDTNVTLPSYHSTDPYAVVTGTRRRLRGLFAGVLLLFVRRADAAPLPTGPGGLELGAWPAVAVPIESGLSLVTPTGVTPRALAEYHTFANRAVDADSAVTTTDAGPTITAPRPTEVTTTLASDVGPGHALLTTTMDGEPAATVIVATSVTVGGNIVPYGGWAMADAEREMHKLRTLRLVLIPLVYVPAAMAAVIIVGIIISVFCSACFPCRRRRRSSWD